MLRNKDEFFNVLKLYFLRAKADRSRLNYLQTDSGEDFISIAF